MQSADERGPIFHNATIAAKAEKQIITCLRCAIEFAQLFRLYQHEFANLTLLRKSAFCYFKQRFSRWNKTCLCFGKFRSLSDSYFPMRTSHTNLESYDDSTRHSIIQHVNSGFSVRAGFLKQRETCSPTWK